MGATVLTFELHKISWREMKLELLHLNWFWLVVAFACMFGYWAMEARVIQVLLKRKQGKFSFRNAFRIPLLEQLFNSITPFSTGGQPAQLVGLIQSGVDPGVAASVCLMKFVIYQLLIVVNFVICVIFGFKKVELQIHQLSWLILLGFLIHIVVVAGLLMIMYWYPMTNKIVALGLKFVSRWIGQERAERLERKVHEKMENFYAESHYMRSQKKLMLHTCLLTTIQLIFYYAVPYFILQALGITHLSFWHVIVLHAFIILIISLFPIPGGSGGAEYTFNMLFGGLVAAQSKLVFAIVLWRIVTLYAGIVIGLVALVVRPSKKVSTQMIQDQMKDQI